MENENLVWLNKDTLYIFFLNSLDVLYIYSDLIKWNISFILLI